MTISFPGQEPLVSDTLEAILHLPVGSVMDSREVDLSSNLIVQIQLPKTN